MQGQIQWRGATVMWDPGDDTYIVLVSAALDSEVAAWLDARLTQHLRMAFVGRDELQARVPQPEIREGRPPMTSLQIGGLREPLPDAPALRSSVNEALDFAIEAASEHALRSDAFAIELRTGSSS